MSYIRARSKRPRHDFSLTIVNVVFLLLLFYLATGSLIKQNELEAEVPFTRDLPLERLPRPLLLITETGALALDGVPVAPSELAHLARAAVEGSPFLNILPERSMSGREFLRILAALEAERVPLRIVTLRAAKDSAGP